MNRTILRDLVVNGENSLVDFKRDDVRKEDLAKEMVALLNLEGGHILLGVEDDGSISGLARSPAETEEWVMNIARDLVQPGFVPTWQCVKMSDNAVVGVIGLSADSPDKPYRARRRGAWTTFLRVGTTSRMASREEDGRLYQSSHVMRYDTRPVLGTSLEDIDAERVRNYLRDIQGRVAVPSTKEDRAWRRLLANIDVLDGAKTTSAVTVAGLLLFGLNPSRRLPQSGISAWSFPGIEKDYNTTDEEVIRGPLVSLGDGDDTVAKGVIDRAVDFVKRNMGTTAWLEGARRRRKPAFPVETIREAIVNAVAHRDYTLAQTDVEVSMYRDRMEVISPGRLPNGVTVQKMADGLRAARNEMLKDVLRDYGYVEHMGLGVRNRIIGAMRKHNGTEPDLVEEESRFIVRLWKQA